MDGIYSMASSSSSVTYGNISCAIRELVLSKFPQNFFQYVNISSEVAFRNFRRLFSNNSNTEIYKRKKPYLVINPTYSVSSPDSFLNDIPLTKNFDDIQYGVDKRYLQRILDDGEKGFALKYKINRDRIEFDITITLATLHHQLDVYKAMVNQFVWERPYSHTVAMEALLPRTMVSYIGNMIHCSIDEDNTSNIPVMLQYLNKISDYPITYKMKNASARDEFFMYYKHNIIVNFTDLNIERGNKKNMVDDYYEITFKVSAEFNLPGLFILEGKPSNIQGLKMDLVSKDYYSGDREFIPIMSLSNFYNQYPSFLNGFKFYVSSMFNVDSGQSDKEHRFDTLETESLFSKEVLRVLKEYNSLNYDMTTLTNIIIMKDNKEMEYKKDWVFNWNSYIAKIYNPEPSSTYRIIVYINNNLINERLSEIAEDESSDKSKA